MIKKVFIIIAIVGVALVTWIYVTPQQIAHSQGETEVQCGQILESEFTKNMEEHIYTLSIEPRWSFNVSVKPYGDDLKTVIILYGPTGLVIDATNVDNFAYAIPQASPSISSGTLSARGKYRLLVENAAVSVSHGNVLNDSTYFGGVGYYTLSVECTTSNGDRINLDDKPLPTATSAPLPTPTLRSAPPENSLPFSGTGFPGLPPVDFSNAITLPLPLGESVTGVMPLDEQILGFTLEADTGDTLDLTYTRSSGNMNLGMVVLSEDNEVFFQASLVTSESLSTRFTLPESGEYTIGIFRIRLVEPSQAKPTLFQIKGVLDPTD
ncbi:MAG: hypothetical protein R3A44_30840 [Caldilineaceae bacterium]